jgi:hypothetical protein
MKSPGCAARIVQALVLCLSLAMRASVRGADETSESVFRKLLALQREYRTVEGELTAEFLRDVDGKWETTGRQRCVWRHDLGKALLHCTIVNYSSRTPGLESLRVVAVTEGGSKFYEKANGTESGVQFASTDIRQDFGYLLPEAVLWDPPNYGWDRYREHLLRIDQENGNLQLVSEVLPGRAEATVIIDPDLNGLPISYSVRDTKTDKMVFRYSTSDYRQVNGLWVPFCYDSEFGDARVVYRVERMEVNGRIERSEFDFEFPEATRVSKRER